MCSAMRSVHLAYPVASTDTLPTKVWEGEDHSRLVLNVHRHILLGHRLVWVQLNLKVPVTKPDRFRTVCFEL